MSHQLPPLNGVRAFEAAARHMSFKLAANELGVTAGAVSQQVKALEAALGVNLFRRLPRGLLLTKIGEAYLPPLSDSFRIISQATEDIAPALPRRKLRVGVSASVKQCLPKNWPQGFNELSAHLTRVMVTEDLELIRSGQLDGILRNHNANGTGLSSELITIDQCHESHKEIHYIAALGLAGCRQSRVLVQHLVELFPPIGTP